MDDFARTLLHMLTAETVDETASLALLALTALVRMQAACLLLWDDELERYTIGETWLAPGGQAAPAPEIRRQALRLGNQAKQADSAQARCVETGIFYQPLNAAHRHIGAYVLMGIEHPPDLSAERYQWLLKSAARALHQTSVAEQANREHAQLLADRERLEQLLQAVEQQQRTIDRLLAAERQFSASLEAKVEERTAALRLAQDQLIRSEKLAVIGQLASSLAHELNNPLQAIRSGLGLVLDEIETGEDLRFVRQDLGVMQEELERIESIFRQMLDFYRPVSHEYLPLDLIAIVEGVRVLLRKRLQEANVTLHLAAEPLLPLTCGDSNQIKQVLLNLILNAAEAMDDAGGNITLRTAYDHGQIYLSVADDGPGIPLEHQDRLFEPLFTTKTRGLGLGLAISRELVQRHGGAISVESQPGVGTTFTVTLPVRRVCHGVESEQHSGR